MHLYALRHGQSTYNLLHLCNDDPRDPAVLTEQGRTQARAVAEQLRTTPLERILCSPLPRTLETAQIVNLHQGLAIEVDARLRDIRSGFNGRPVAEYQAAIAHDRMRAAVNGGESLLAHQQRVSTFLVWLRQEPQQYILLVAHEETLRVIDGYCRGLAEAEMIDLSFGNCALRHYVL